jgi:ABC-type sugar transport system ATPase subunit
MSGIEVKNLTAKYSDKIILEKISFQVKSSEILAIIGESGSGKSTLLNLLAGLLQQESGEVILEKEILEGPVGKLIAGHQHIKLVAQEYRLNPNFTVFENIAYSIRNYTKAYQNERVNELMKALSISHLQDKLPKNISGGEKQRTAIAKAIADVPKVLLLDEPFSNLDNINKSKLKLSLTKLIKKEKIACVFVTHDLLDAIQIADNVGVIQNSKLLEIIPAQKLIKFKGNKYIENYIEASFEGIKQFFK